MRILLLAVLLFVTFHFIRMDLVEGTIPLASFTDQQQKQQCDEQTAVKVIPVTTVDGDTIESLFALYPDPATSFVDRLSSFYSLNPHLQNQSLIGGEKIKLPLTDSDGNSCME